MSLISVEELVRGAMLVTFGSLAGGAVLAFPGSPLWLLPAAIGAAGSACTIPEVRAEVQRVLPMLAEGAASMPRLVASVRAGRMPRLLRSAEQDQPVPDEQPELVADGTLLTTLAAPPHRLVVGHTGGGKTTLLHEYVRQQAEAGALVLVCDPDAAPGQWPGARVVGGGDNYAAIGQALALVEKEMEKRSEARGQAGRRTFRPIDVIIDEAQDVFAEVENARACASSLARRGRKLGLRLTLGCQDTQVATLGLEGKSHILRNFTRVDVRKDVTGRRVAQMQDGRTLVVPDLPDPEAYIREGAVTGVTTALGRGSNTSGVTVTVAPATGNGNGNGAVPAEERPSAAGVTVNVQAVAVAPVTRTRAPGKGLDIRARVRRIKAARHATSASALHAAYREAGAAGVSYRQAYKELGGSREATHAAWKEGRAATEIPR